MAERKRPDLDTRDEFSIDEIPFDGLEMLSTGGPIAADEATSTAEELEAEIMPSNTMGGPPAKPQHARAAKISGGASVTIAVPSGYNLDPIWGEIDDETRAATLTCASTMLGAGMSIGKIRATDADLRRTLLDVQRQFAESRLLHAAELVAERTKLESEVTFLRKDLSATMSKIGDTVSAAFGARSSAKEKGDIGEGIVEKWMTEWFPGSTIEKCGAGHLTDFIVTLPLETKMHAGARLRILVEVKNKARIQTTDVDQFERDISENRLAVDAAIFVSLRCVRIPNRGELQVRTIGKVTTIYLGGLIEQQSRDVKIAIQMLQQFAARERALADPDAGRESMAAAMGRTLKILRDAETRAQRAVKAAIQLQQDVSFLSETILTVSGIVSAVSAIGPEVVHGRTKIVPGKIVRSGLTSKTHSAKVVVPKMVAEAAVSYDLDDILG